MVPDASALGPARPDSLPLFAISTRNRELETSLPSALLYAENPDQRPRTHFRRLAQHVVSRLLKLVGFETQAG